ncbi:MAG: SPASM domain-containing protein, partial [Planctomycetota bacterium]
TTVRGPHMEPETFEKISEVLFPHIESFQPSVSGEPLMSKGLDRVLDKAREFGIRAEYYCNGTLLNDRMARLILPTLGRLNISFDGASKATFESLRRGARWDTVLANVKGIVAAANELPPDQRPQIGFACTLMVANIRELPDLVDLAADLGVDFVCAAHVLPGTAEVQSESLFHHQEMAQECIDHALERARERGMPFSVQPLDNLISTVAATDEMTSPHFRSGSNEDGVVAGLPAREVHTDKWRPWPPGVPVGADADKVAARQAARAEPAAREHDSGKTPKPIWTCDYLWGKLYVAHDGNTAPCCVPGVPGLGNLVTRGLEEIWNGDLERSMRIGLVRQEPAPCCRGCQHIREVTDPAEVRRLLQGKTVPDQSPLLPSALRPVTAGATVETQELQTFVDTPVLAWQGHADTAGYEVEMSLDGFRTLLFSTLWHDLQLAEPRFQIPEWAWVLAPVDETIHWRALAVLPEERRVTARGTFRRRGGEHNA